MFFRKKNKKEQRQQQRLKLKFYYQNGNLIGTRPPVVWSRQLYDVVFGDQDFINRITKGNIYIKESPYTLKKDRDLIDLYDLYTSQNNIAKVVGIDFDGLDVEPINNQYFKDHHKLTAKPIFIRIGDDILFVCFNLVHKIERA